MVCLYGNKSLNLQYSVYLFLGNLMRVNIVVAMITYNSSLTIDCAIRSLLRQRNISRPFFVLIDSYSNDNTVDRAVNLLNSAGIEYKVVRYKSNIAQARNRAIVEALKRDPDYVFFLDSDVVLAYSDSLEKAVRISNGRRVVYLDYLHKYFDTVSDLRNECSNIERRYKNASLTPRLRQVRWCGLGATLIPASLLRGFKFTPSLYFREDRELGLYAWAKGYPVILVKAVTNNGVITYPAYDLNLRKGKESNLYLRLGLREYLSGLSRRVLVHDVWTHYKDSFIKSFLSFIRESRSYPKYLAVDLLIVASIMYSYFSNNYIYFVALLLALLGGAAVYARRRGIEFLDALRQLTKFNLAALGSYALYIPSYISNKDLLEKAYKNFTEYNDAPENL